jgi:hypothetical protein
MNSRRLVNCWGTEDRTDLAALRNGHAVLTSPERHFCSLCTRAANARARHCLKRQGRTECGPAILAIQQPRSSHPSTSAVRAAARQSRRARLCHQTPGPPPPTRSTTTAPEKTWCRRPAPRPGWARGRPSTHGPLASARPMRVSARTSLMSPGFSACWLNFVVKIDVACFVPSATRLF